MSEICKICGKECKDLRGLSKHINHKHSNITKKEYYDKYLKQNWEGYCLYCGKETSFLGLNGYPKYCHSHYSKTDEAKKLNSKKQIGKKRSYKTRKKISERLRGQVKSAEHCMNLSKTRKLKPSSGMTGKKHKKSTLIKMSKVLKGKKSWNEGKKLSANTCRKIRIASIRNRERQLSNGEPLYPRIGNIERPFLNELQKLCPFEILRQDPSFRYTIGRFPDGYVKELKLFILFDEPAHFDDIECLVLNEESSLESRDYESIKDHNLFRVSQRDWDDNPEKIKKEFKEIICQKEN